MPHCEFIHISNGRTYKIGDVCGRRTHADLPFCYTHRGIDKRVNDLRKKNIVTVIERTNTPPAPPKQREEPDLELDLTTRPELTKEEVAVLSKEGMSAKKPGDIEFVQLLNSEKMYGNVARKKSAGKKKNGKRSHK